MQNQSFNLGFWGVMVIRTTSLRSFICQTCSGPSTCAAVSNWCWADGLQAAPFTVLCCAQWTIRCQNCGLPRFGSCKCPKNLGFWPNREPWRETWGEALGWFSNLGLSFFPCWVSWARVPPIHSPLTHQPHMHLELQEAAHQLCTKMPMLGREKQGWS